MGSIEDRDSEIRSELTALSARVGALEQLLQGEPQGRRELPSGPITGQNAVSGAPSFPPAVSVADPPGPALAAKRQQSLESRIGSSFLNRVGVIAVMIGMAWFLKLAIDRNWIGPPIRILIGLAIAVGLVLWSERFRRRNFTAFSYSLKALGTGIAYLSLWAAYSVYALVAPGTAFAAMVVVTLGNGVQAWMQGSELLAVYALLGGLATPALLSTGENHELFLFSYLLLLDVAAVVLSAARPWSRLVFGAFAGTAIYFGTWWVSYYSAEAFGLTGFFLLLFFLLFTAAPLLTLFAGKPPGDRQLGASGRYQLVFGAFMVTGLPVLVHLWAFVAGWFWAGSERGLLRSWVALGLAVSSVGVDLVVRGFDSRFAPSNAEEGSAGRSAGNLLDRLADVHFGLAIFFVALAAWIEYQRHAISLPWLSVCWLTEALVLAAVVVFGHPHHHHTATAMDRVTPPRVFATLMMVAASADLLLLEWLDPPAYFTRPVFNSHLLTYVAGLAVFAATAWMCRLAVAAHPLSAANVSAANAVQRGRLGGMQVEPGSILFLGAYAVVMFNVLALVAGSVQIHLYWAREQLQESALRLQTAGPRTVGFSYSGWFMVYGAVLMAVGFLRRSAFLRWQALLLLAFAIAKVFIVDASRLSQGYRVMSFLGLGALLLTISFAYQRDWLALRDRE